MNAHPRVWSLAISCGLISAACSKAEVAPAIVGDAEPLASPMSREPLVAAPTTPPSEALVAAPTAGGVHLVEAGLEPRKVLRWKPLARAVTQVGLQADSVTQQGTATVDYSYRMHGHTTVDSVSAAGGWSSTLTIDRLALVAGADPAEAAEAGERLVGARMLSERDAAGTLVRMSVSDPASPLSTDDHPLTMTARYVIVPLPAEAVGVGASWEARARWALMGAEVEELWRVTLVELTEVGAVVDVAFTGTMAAKTVTIDKAFGPVPVETFERRGKGRVNLDLVTMAGFAELLWIQNLTVAVPGPNGASPASFSEQITAKMGTAPAPATTQLPVVCEVAASVLFACGTHLPEHAREAAALADKLAQDIAKELAAGRAPEKFAAGCHEMLVSFADVPAACRKVAWTPTPAVTTAPSCTHLFDRYAACQAATSDGALKKAIADGLASMHRTLEGANDDVCTDLLATVKEGFGGFCPTVDWTYHP